MALGLPPPCRINAGAGSGRASPGGMGGRFPPHLDGRLLCGGRLLELEVPYCFGPLCRDGYGLLGPARGRPHPPPPARSRRRGVIASARAGARSPRLRFSPLPPRASPVDSASPGSPGDVLGARRGHVAWGPHRVGPGPPCGSFFAHCWPRHGTNRMRAAVRGRLNFLRRRSKGCVCAGAKPSRPAQTPCHLTWGRRTTAWARYPRGTSRRRCPGATRAESKSPCLGPAAPTAREADLLESQKTP